MRIREDEHSPLCKRSEKVAWRHDWELFTHVVAMAIRFIENHPGNISITPHSEQPKIEIRICRYCGHPQVQFGHKRHSKGCIVRKMRGAIRRMQEHQAWHDGWWNGEITFELPQTRKEKADLRHFFKFKSIKPLIKKTSETESDRSG